MFAFSIGTTLDKKQVSMLIVCFYLLQRLFILNGNAYILLIDKGTINFLMLNDHAFS